MVDDMTAEDRELTEAVRRYLSCEVNRGHYERVNDGPLPEDGSAYANSLIALRRRELQDWQRTWWSRLSLHPKRILDAGCGPGFVAAALADALPESQIVGVDIEPEAVAVARLLAGRRANRAFHT